MHRSGDALRKRAGRSHLSTPAGVFAGEHLTETIAPKSTTGVQYNARYSAALNSCERCYAQSTLSARSGAVSGGRGRRAAAGGARACDTRIDTSEKAKIEITGRNLYALCFFSAIYHKKCAVRGGAAGASFVLRQTAEAPPLGRGRGAFAVRRRRRYA
ncbi:hypothetical protein EVAR_8352_1 [Eumeta japonica]|uniref:Uncharacterized protein n=1 Tax=Eumeta variegata TaxID=151549 RepID=A0A4C1VD34_EUMVA|nr:hypothetical protein EVAR_8352_1 [Eumeta japonica]